MNTIWILYTSIFLIGLGFLIVGIIVGNITLTLVGLITGIALFLTKNHVR